MTLDPSDLDPRISRAARHFWLTRSAQAEKQGKATGRRDAGSRAAVTGGAQMDGRVLTDLLHANGIPQAYVRTSKGMELPGWFRAEKKWDLLVIADGKLLAGMTKLMRERLYDATCFLVSDAREGPRGVYREPSRELRFENFAASLLGRALAITKSK